MGEILVADLETDGLKPNRIWVVGIISMETGEYRAYVGDEEVPEGLMRLANAERIIGHSFKSYDAQVISKLTEGLIVIDPDKIDDTVEISRALFPNLKNHKLKTWGEILGVPKIEYTGGFDEFHEDMLPYCKRDVELNKLLYEFLLSQLEEAA